MENKLFNVPVELFQLDELKINKEKICKVKYRLTDKTGAITDVFKNTTEPNYQCNEVMQGKIADLKEYLCDIAHITKEHRTKVNSTGVVLTGVGEKATFELHGVNTSDSEQRMPFKTCKVIASDCNFGFEVDVENIIEDLRILAHGYLFEDQRAQLSFNLDNGNAEKVEEQESETVE